MLGLIGACTYVAAWPSLYISDDLLLIALGRNGVAPSDGQRTPRGLTALSDLLTP